MTSVSASHTLDSITAREIRASCCLTQAANRSCRIGQSARLQTRALDNPGERFV
jgi:hypothetical protein